MANKFFANSELKDKKIVAALEQAAKDYENGEIVEVRRLLFRIVAAISKWEKLQ